MNSKKQKDSVKKRFFARISLVLSAMLTVTLLPFMTLQAEAARKTPLTGSSLEAASEKTEKTKTGKMTFENEIFKDIEGKSGTQSRAAEAETECSTVNSLAAYISKQMTSRIGKFTVRYTGSDYDDYGLQSKIKTELLPRVFSIDTASTSDADYLYNIYDTIQIDYVLNFDSKYMKMIFEVTYQETAEETKYVDDVVTDILKEIEPAGKTEYERVKAAHDWICTNVEKENASAGTNRTAYAALKNGKATTSGYAGLNYKLLSALGMKTAIIRGPSKGADTAIWNLTKIGNKWYHEDVYRGDTDSGATYDYFLKGNAVGDAKWNVHTNYAGYTAYYEMSEIDYNPDVDEESPEDAKALVKITAVYQGNDMHINTFIPKGKILVNAHYNDDTIAPVKVFELSQTMITKIGDNVITVYYMGKSAEVTIKGIQPTETGDAIKITFNAQGGSKVSTISNIDKNKTVDISTITSERAGFIFQGWYLDKDGVTKCPTKFKIAESITLYAKWAKIELSFIKVKYNGARIELLPVYKKDLEGNIETDETGAKVIEKWEGTINREDVIVTGYYNDGSEQQITNFKLSQDKFTYGRTETPDLDLPIEVIVTAEEKTDSFYIYLNGGNGNWDPGTETPTPIPTVNLTLVANNGDTTDEVVTGIEKYTRFSAIDDQIETPTRKGYMFMGWYYRTNNDDVPIDGSEPPTDENLPAFIQKVTPYTRISKDMKLYAKWKLVELVKVTVEYTGFPLQVRTNINLNDVMVKAFYNDYSVKEILNNYIESGDENRYSISGFLITNEGPNEFVINYQETYVNGDKSDEWELKFEVTGLPTTTQTYRVTFDSMGGSAIPAITGVPKGDTIKLPDPPTRDGYIFVGWYRDTAYYVPFTEASTIVADTTLYAKWVPFKKIPLSIQAGYIGGALEQGDEIDQKSIRVLASYNDSTMGEIEEFDYAPKTMQQAGSNSITVTYQYDAAEEPLRTVVIITTGEAAKTYTVTYDTQGGDKLPPAKDILWGSKITLPTPKKTNDTFEGWYTSTDFKKEFTNEDYVLNDMTLYAKWAKGNDTAVAVESIKAEYSGGNLAVGASIDKSKIKVTATYEDGTTKEVTGFTISPDKVKAKGANVVSVKFKGKSTTITITGIESSKGDTNKPGNNNNNNNNSNNNNSNKDPNKNDPNKNNNSNKQPEKDKHLENDEIERTADELKKKVQDLVDEISKKAGNKEGSSDSYLDKIREALALLNSLNPIEKAAIPEQTLAQLDQLIENLTNVTYQVEGDLEDFEIKRENVRGLGLVLDPEDLTVKDKVLVTLQAREHQMSPSELERMEQFAKINGKEILKYLDLTILKKKNKDNPVQITDANNAVRFELSIPEKFAGKKSYCMLRDHNQKMEMLEDLDELETIFTFESDKYSVFAFAYDLAAEAGIAAGEAGQTESENSEGGEDALEEAEVSSAKKNSMIPFILCVAAIIVLAILMITIAFVTDKSDEEEDEEELPVAIPEAKEPEPVES